MYVLFTHADVIDSGLILLHERQTLFYPQKFTVCDKSSLTIDY